MKYAPFISIDSKAPATSLLLKDALFIMGHLFEQVMNLLTSRLNRPQQQWYCRHKLFYTNRTWLSFLLPSPYSLSYSQEARWDFNIKQVLTVLGIFLSYMSVLKGGKLLDLTSKTFYWPQDIIYWINIGFQTHPLNNPQATLPLSPAESPRTPYTGQSRGSVPVTSDSGGF